MSFHGEMAVMFQTTPHVIGGGGGVAILLSIRSSAWKMKGRAFHSLFTFLCKFDMKRVFKGIRHFPGHLMSP